MLVQQPVSEGFLQQSARMSTKLYVGNLSWQATADDLRQAFSAYGEVEDAFIPSDRETGR